MGKQNCNVHVLDLSRRSEGLPVASVRRRGMGCCQGSEEGLTEEGKWFILRGEGPSRPYRCGCLRYGLFVAQV